MVGGVVLLAVGCKAPALTAEEQFKLPETFAAGADADTVTIASMAWQDFFPDAYLKEYIDTALVRNHSFL